MYAILRQAKANLRCGRLQSALILLTLLAAAALLTVALSTLHIAQGAYDRLFERTHGAHLWLELDPERAVEWLVQARERDPDLPGLEQKISKMARELRAKADDARKRRKIEVAYAAYRDSLRLDPYQPWARRYAEELREQRLRRRMARRMKEAGDQGGAR